MERKFKIIMLCLPASGHINPMVSLANDLNKSNKCHIIFYGNLEHKKLIESSRSEFRNIELVDPTERMNPNQLRNDFPVDIMMQMFMDSYDKFEPELMRTLEAEDVDMIMYDFLTAYGNWFVQKLKKLKQQGKLKKKLPKFVAFYPSFVMDESLFPNVAEKVYLPKPKLSFKFVLKMLVFAIKYIYFCWSRSVQLMNPAKFLFPKREELNLCCIIPELQPRSYLYPKSVQFIGSCASEEIRSVKEFVETWKSFVEPLMRFYP